MSYTEKTHEAQPFLDPRDAMWRIRYKELIEEIESMHDASTHTTENDLRDLVHGIIQLIYDAREVLRVQNKSVTIPPVSEELKD